MSDLLVQLETAPVEGLRPALARALGDPSLEIAFWLPERREYVDASGRRVELPLEGRTRAVTPLAHEGKALAALVHDPSLLDQPKLVQAAGAAARLTLENARLQAEIRAQLTNVQESRTRIVQATDDERRRIERDLHDGAQQRLVALALELRSAREQLGDRSGSAVQQLLADAVAELQAAVSELRELGRGLHPAILSEEGLAAALESLVGRSPLPVSLVACDERFPERVEATAYFVACEALANALKHSQASSLAITARHKSGTLSVEISDDGVGGAHLEDRGGLRGLADRVEALGGSLTVVSAPAQGTRVIAEIPCAQ